MGLESVTFWPNFSTSDFSKTHVESTARSTLENFVVIL